MDIQDDLIYDLGANQGEDTEFYLAKGFRVVAVEANPLLYAALAERFAEPVASGRLTLLNLGVWSAAGTTPFYLNEDNSHWSSFDPRYGIRPGTRHRVLEIPCVTATDLLVRYGVPHYLKIDIEGADPLVLAQLRGQSLRPRYISVEEYGVGTLFDLIALGYEHFKIVTQRDKSWAVPPDPPREGRYAPRVSTGADSGLFGAELPGEWLTIDPAVAAFTSGVCTFSRQRVGPAEEWWDVHAGR